MRLSPADWKTLGDAVDKRVFEAASAKHPDAKADTYYYLFEVGSGFLRGSPEVLQKLAAVAPSASSWVIYQLLTTDWEEISSVRAQLLPTLQQTVARSWPSWGLHVGGMALLRLAELDPPAAPAHAAMKDLISPQGRFSDPELLELSLPASPALDQALLAQYRQGAPVDARIARFASADIKDDLWRAWSARPGQICVTPLFAYFFRVDPVQAAERLDELRKAGGNACATLDFYEAERQLISPGLERQLLADAKSANPNIRQAAFRMLSVAGSRAALPVLLHAIEASPALKQESIAAVLRGRRWILTGADYARLAKDCAGTSFCAEIERARRAAHPPYTLRLFDFNGRSGFWLSNRQVDSLADLAALADQFPSGTPFRWDPDSRPAKPAEREMRERVRALLTSRRMTVQE